MKTGQLLNKTWVQMTFITALIVALFLFAIKSHDGSETKTVDETTEAKQILCLAVADDKTIEPITCD